MSADDTTSSVEKGERSTACELDAWDECQRYSHNHTPTDEKPQQLDHGELNIPLAKRYGKGGIDAAVDRHLAAERREARRQARAAAQDRRAAKLARAVARPLLTATELQGAVVVRDRFGWHRVVRVNAKSVTVATGHSWDDRIAISQIMEARHA